MTKVITIPDIEKPIQELTEHQNVSGNKEGGISVTQEPKIIVKSVAVDLFPISVYKGRYQQEQGALGLVEIGYHHLHDVVLVARSYDDLGACLEHIKMMTVQVIQYILKRLYG